VLEVVGLGGTRETGDDVELLVHAVNAAPASAVEVAHLIVAVVALATTRLLPTKGGRARGAACLADRLVSSYNGPAGS